jgi:hypothetical protein
MNDGIFLVQENGALIEMHEKEYDSEDILQQLIARYPNLLSGNQIDSDSPRKWLLVSRETPVASEDNGTDRWSMDHLLLDQDAIPTLVEVKRSSDTRIRREVVGQMLDYAANIIAYCPMEKMRSQFEAHCNLDKVEPEQKILQHFEAELNYEEFWQKVKTNLQAGRIRMLFVADEIPSELQRIVEFLNEQMDPAEVLAVEIKQFLGEGFKTLVPRVLGQVSKKVTRRTEGKIWDAPSFMAAIKERHGADAVALAEDILKWANLKNLSITWGRGAQDGSLQVQISHHGEILPLFNVWTYGRVEILFAYMKDNFLCADVSRQKELMARLEQVQRKPFSSDALNKRPSFPLPIFKDKAVLKQFLDTWEWYIQQIRASQNV